MSFLEEPIMRPLNIHLQSCSYGKDKTETDNNNTKSSALASLNTQSSKRNLYNYADRLKTYDGWPNEYVSKEQLAEAGFYYTKKDDIVKCAFCLVEGYQWVAGDDPRKDHVKWSPRCPFFLMNGTSSNGPSEKRAQDTCGLYGITIHPNAIPEGEFGLERLGIRRNQGPSHPQYYSYDSRLKTFKDWPTSSKQKPKELAEAGLYYVGEEDQTLCFHCGGGLKNWEDNDEPWEQHALWFPKCPFVYLEKGIDYINNIKRKVDPRWSPEPSTSSSASSSASSSLSSSYEQAKEKEDEKPIETTTTTTTEKKDNENSQDEKTLCKICYKDEVGVVFLPCGHVVACVKCSTALKKCAVCRKPLEATVRAYLS